MVRGIIRAERTVTGIPGRIGKCAGLSFEHFVL